MNTTNNLKKFFFIAIIYNSVNAIFFSAEQTSMKVVSNIKTKEIMLNSKNITKKIKKGDNNTDASTDDEDDDQSTEGAEEKEKSDKKTKGKEDKNTEIEKDSEDED